MRLIAAFLLSLRAFAQPDSRALNAAEVEHLVLHDRSADRSPELIQPVRRLGGSRAVSEEIRRIELIVAQEFEQRAVKIVSAGLR